MKHVSPKHKKLITIVLIVVVALIAAVSIKLYLADADAPEGMRQVRSYRDTSNDEVVCLGLSPSCGVCSGKVINQKCYVKKGTYEYYE